MLLDSTFLKIHSLETFFESLRNRNQLKSYFGRLLWPYVKTDIEPIAKCIKCGKDDGIIKSTTSTVVLIQEIDKKIDGNHKNYMGTIEQQIETYFNNEIYREEQCHSYPKCKEFVKMQ